MRNSDRRHRPKASRARAILAVGLAAVLTAAAVAGAATPSPSEGVAAEAHRLNAALLASLRDVRKKAAPEARALARELPRSRERAGSLRERAATTEEQIGIALGQLQQMSALRYDPHYIPALIAVGRAHLAATGADPLTGTAVSPEYAGLSRELAATETALRRSGTRAARLSRAVRALNKRLAEERRRAGRLAAALDRRLRGR